MAERRVGTRARGLGRGRALAVCGTVILAMIAMVVAQAVTPLPAGVSGGDIGDLALYRLVVGKLRAGGSYYRLMHDMLVENGFGTGSVFNWRTPFLLQALSLLPSLAWAQGLLVTLLLVIAAAAAKLLWREGGRVLTLLGVAALVSSLATVFAPDAILFAEIPAGMLMVLSAILYGLKRPYAGMAMGGAALFVRELAGVYVILCMLQAWRQKRYRELAGWVVILAAYAIYFGMHYHNVQLNTLPGDPHYPSGWLAWGGLGFVGATASFNGIFLLLPGWVGAMTVPLALLGLWAWPGRAGRMIALLVMGYVLLFLAVGKSFNIYWGALYTPALSLGLAWLPFAVLDLIECCRRPARRDSSPKPISQPETPS